jgi:hypothetical protein
VKRLHPNNSAPEETVSMKRRTETELKNCQRQTTKLSVSSGTLHRKEEVYLLLSGAFRSILLPKGEEVKRMQCNKSPTD